MPAIGHIVDQYGIMLIKRQVMISNNQAHSSHRFDMHVNHERKKYLSIRTQVLCLSSLTNIIDVKDNVQVFLKIAKNHARFRAEQGC